MKGVIRPSGYTIVEVMIVLAISGAMFLIAANFISGKQAATAFTAGSHEFTSQVQDVINQVITGKYSDVGFTCTTSAPPTSTISISSAPSAQGTNPDCVFLAKAIQINDNSDPTKYAVYTLAGARNSPSITNMMPVIAGSALDLTAHFAVPQSLKITSVTVDKYLGTEEDDVKSFGFAQSTNNSSFGAQTVNLIYLPPANTLAAATTASFLTAQSVTVCITDSSRYADVTIGSASNADQLTAVLKVTTKAAC